jgi:hypothetical protein
VPVSKTSDESLEPEEFSVNSIEQNLSVAWELFTDERYGLKLQWAYSWYWVLDDRVEQTGGYEYFYPNGRSKEAHINVHNYWTADFLAYIKPDRDGRGKLFFRYRYYVKADDWKLNWSQVQLGYAFTFTKTQLPSAIKQ